MTEDTAGVGARIARRRARLGLKKAQLAQMVGIHRNTLGAIESGAAQPHDTTLAKLDKILGDMEEEWGLDCDDSAEAPSEVTFTLRGASGAEVTVAGPVASLPALEEAALRLLARLARDEPADRTPNP